MGLTGWIVGLFGDGDREIYECRECGTDLASPEECCPYCGPTEVARFELPE